ncbi:GBP3-like protein [Mya arenaria]|uniref:GBP3-like protein n=1 Tax=Mya arenaria TaxID=6604 RepID=A0ABY7EYJ4_MYAAR|nr:GBP3-like protein [Mya arenaria]
MIQGDSNHDNRIFTLATLLCSTLVYNMKGAFDQDAVNKLTFVSEMSKSIRFGRRCDENNLLLQSILPGFVLALRDFSLKFIKGKRQLTPDEYLEEGLENKPEKRAYFNKPRECIRKFFPQEKRKCFAFPVPGDADTLENLDSLKFQDLSHRFQTVATQFVSYIYRQEPKQLQVSELVNGPMFATLTRRYVDAFAKGIVPDVDDAFSTVATIENRRVKDECMIMFRSRTNDMKLPLPSKSLDKHFKEARWSALEYMRTNAVQDVANIVEREAQMEMDLLWQQFQSQNKEEKEKHCTKVLSGLPSFSNLQARLQKTDYEVLGGHRKFKRDVDMVKQKYEQALREYEQPREIGLVWNNFVSDLCADENKILEKDNELSEDEKAREKEENAKSMERMKVEMAEANQKALAKQRNELDEQQKKLDAERERRDTEHQNKIADLQNKLAATLDENKEAQRRMLKQIRALHEEAEKRREEMNNKFEAMQKRRGGNILDVFFNTVKDIFDP